MRRGINELDLHFSGGVVVRGRVVDEAGAPLGGAWVQIHAFTAAGQGASSAGLDHEGRFQLDDLAAGRWTVVARLDSEGRRTTAETRVDPQGPTAQVVIEFGQGLTLDGVVRIAGKPLADAIVNLEGRDVAAMGWSRTDNEGRFRITHVTDGTWMLRTQRKGYAATSLVLSTAPQ